MNRSYSARHVSWMEVAVMLSQSISKRTVWLKGRGWQVDGGEPWLIESSGTRMPHPSSIESFFEDGCTEFRWVGAKP